jgi:hypothetical protein
VPAPEKQKAPFERSRFIRLSTTESICELCHLKIRSRTPACLAVAESVHSEFCSGYSMSPGRPGVEKWP